MQLDVQNVDENEKPRIIGDSNNDAHNTIHHSGSKFFSANKNRIKRKMTEDSMDSLDIEKEEFDSVPADERLNTKQLNYKKNKLKRVFVKYDANPEYPEDSFLNPVNQKYFRIIAQALKSSVDEKLLDQVQFLKEMDLKSYENPSLSESQVKQILNLVQDDMD